MKKVIISILIGQLFFVPCYTEAQWSLTGNGSTTPGTNFLGTTDNNRLVFKTNNTEWVTILENGNVGIGLNNPTAPLQVQGTFIVTHPTYTGSFSILQTANNQFRFFNSGIGEFLRAGPSNTVDFLGQQIRATNRGAYLSNSLGGNALFTVAGNVVLNSTSGNTLIGTTTDDAANKLQVSGNVKADGLIIPTGAAAGKVLTSDANGNATWEVATGGTAGWSLAGNSFSSGQKLGTTDNSDLPIITNNIERVRVTLDGNVGIGTVTPQAKLAVNGDIYSKKIKVTQTGWPDYVFYPSYSLRPLIEVEQFILQHHHLPDVPSAEEVERNGLDLGQGQAMLLKKIEELTLYLIAQDKKIEKLIAENMELQGLKMEEEKIKSEKLYR